MMSVQRVGLLVILFMSLFHQQLNLNVYHIIGAIITFTLIVMLINRRQTIEHMVEYARPEPITSIVEDNSPFQFTHNGDVMTDNNMSVYGDLATRGDLMVEKNSHVKGNEMINGRLSVAGDMNVDSKAIIKNDLDVLGDTSTAGVLRVGGVSTLGDNLGVGGNVQVRQNLGVEGDSVLSNVAVNGDQIIDGRLSVTRQVGRGLDHSVEISAVDGGYGSIIESSCPPNHFVCGMKIRNDDEQLELDRNHDRMGINGAWLKCCSFQ